MPIPYVAGEALTCQQIRELDILAIEHVGLPGIVLMENAGRAVADTVFEALLNPADSRVLALCGPGNNGGDAFVAARHLRNAGVHVVAALAAPPDKSKGDAAVNLGVLERTGTPLLRAYEEAGLAELRREIEHADIIVDGLLGTGSRGDPRGVVADLIRLANEATRPRRVAIDVPSGLDGDTGLASAVCFRADATVTFVSAKPGFAAPAARAVLGRVTVASIGLPVQLIPGRGHLHHEA